MGKYIKGISKLRSKDYPFIVEIKVPIRFYFNNNADYDGFEFGPLSECSKYQISLLRVIVDLFSHQMNATKVFEYMLENHKEELGKILLELEAKDLDIPKAFIDAFKGNEDK